MMETEGHAQLVLIRVGVADAAFKTGRSHLAHGGHAIDSGALNQLFKVLVHVRAIRYQGAACAAITGDVLDNLGL